MTRKHDALDSNPFKNFDKKEHEDHKPFANNNNNNNNKGGDLDDLDDLIMELEAKNKKKDKLPMILTKDKFHKP